jgi:dihydrofolate reductase
VRKVILSMMVSLDGFIEGPNRELDWTIVDKEIDSYADDLLSTVDAILLGRRTYQLFAGFWPTASTEEEIIANKMNEIPKFVFSRTLDKAPWGKWNNARLVRENIAEEISKMKKQPGKNMVIFGGASLAQTFMQHDLIDEYRLLVQPIVLGSGTPLFKSGSDRIDLQLLKTQKFNSGVVGLYYQPAKQ